MRLSRCGSTFAALAALAAIGAATPVNAGGVKFAGDFRLRYENTQNQIPGSPVMEERNREVVRFRASLSKNINDKVAFGARVATGSSGDPNTADVTLGSFLNDLEISLDRAFLEFRHEGVSLVGGKFANPFQRTDLVWDGDVNPQGVAAKLSHKGDGVAAKLTGIASIVDEQSNSDVKDSRMFGVQGEFTVTPDDSDVSVTVAGAYYDYEIPNLSNADAGDTRSNVLNMAGDAYVSDFDLFDVIGILELNRGSRRYPVKVVGDYVKNIGAEIPGDQGFSVDVFLGRASKRNDARFRYGYSEADTDAVLAAFSHDNTTIATNYQQHTVTVDWVALDDTTLNATWYLYQFKDRSSGLSDELVSRLRINAMVTF